MPSEVRFAQVLNDLLNERFRRNRAELAAKANVSPSALSQYVRERATPSLDVLVHLADALGVSLDYLVFGRERDLLAASTDYVSSQLDSGIRKAQTDAAELYDLVARVGARLGNKIEQIAREVLPDSAGSAGTLTVEEIMELESFSNSTTIVTSSLETEVLVVETGKDQSAPVPGLFADPVIANIQRHYRYEYFVPLGGDVSEDAELLRKQILERSGLSPALVDRYLKIHQVPRACVPGFVIFEVVEADLRSGAPSIFDRVAPFFSDTTGQPGLMHVAALEPASRSYRQFGLLDLAKIPSVLKGLEDLKGAVPLAAEPTGSE